MTISYTRKDKSGNFVEVEVWRDDETYEFVRIKRVTYIKDAGFVTFRTDIYREENEEEFEKTLGEELDFLNKYKEVAKEITTIPVKEEEPNGEVQLDGLDGLAATVDWLNAHKGEGR